MDWANSYNIAVLVCIHGAKGSQNGADHSAAEDPGNTYWSDYPENVDNTLTVADFLVRRYKDRPSFLGLDLINEPSGKTNIDVLKNYYTRAHDMIRSYSDCVLVHPPLLYQQDLTQGAWQDFTPPPRYTNMWHEWHNYLIWGFQSYSEDALIDYARGTLANTISGWNGNWLFNGEWSLASEPRFDDESKFRTWARVYLNAVNRCKSGWTYWTWKVSGDENGGRNAWSMRQMLQRGYLQIDSVYRAVGDVPTNAVSNSGGVQHSISSTVILVIGAIIVVVVLVVIAFLLTKKFNAEKTKVETV